MGCERRGARGAWFLALIALLIGGLAQAEPTGEPAAEEGLSLGGAIGVGVRMQTTSAIDLAGLAGASGYGAANDASPAALGLALSGGLLVDDWELLVEGMLAFGGLSLAGVEERYFNAEPQPIGGAPTVSLMGAGRYVFALGALGELAAGFGGGVVIMGASSPVGGGYFRAISVGPEAEIRIKLAAGGTLGLGLDARLLVPYVAEVSGGEPKFALDGIGDPVWMGGAALTYRHGWR